MQQRAAAHRKVGGSGEPPCLQPTPPKHRASNHQQTRTSAHEGHALVIEQPIACATPFSRRTRVSDLSVRAFLCEPIARVSICEPIARVSKCLTMRAQLCQHVSPYMYRHTCCMVNNMYRHTWRYNSVTMYRHVSTLSTCIAMRAQLCQHVSPGHHLRCAILPTHRHVSQRHAPSERHAHRSPRRRESLPLCCLPRAASAGLRTRDVCRAMSSCTASAS